VKIGILGENYYPTLGGVQEHIYQLALYLRRTGHDARVITGLPQVDRWRGPQDEPWVMRVGRARRYGVMGTRTTMTFGPGVAWRLRRLLRDERFDLVHVHAPADIGLPMLLYALHRGPIVATLHSPINDASPARRLLAPYYQWVLNRTDQVISVSEAAQAAMSRYARFDSRIVANGVDAAALGSGRPLARFADGRTNILMLGRLEPRNGPDLMFRALPAIVKARPDVRLLVAGEGKDGTAAHEAMVPADLRDHVVFLGPVFEERPDVYASARLCVVPARSGTFSIIILEALAAGVPVVATPFIHKWETLPHFGPVRVTRDFEPETIAAEVLAALAEDPADRRARGQEVARRFDWSAVGAQILSVYEDVLDARAGRRPRAVAPDAALP
jgi:phosphatidylinositol alpha-mannosyltransferase